MKLALYFKIDGGDTTISILNISKSSDVSVLLNMFVSIDANKYET